MMNTLRQRISTTPSLPTPRLILRHDPYCLDEGNRPTREWKKLRAYTVAAGDGSGIPPPHLANCRSNDKISAPVKNDKRVFFGGRFDAQF